MLHILVEKDNCLFFQVRSEYLVPRTAISYPDGKQSTVLGLKFVVKARHFITTPKQQREMKLRCTATLSEVKRMTSEPLDALMSPPHMRHKSDLHVDEDHTGIAGECHTVRKVFHLTPVHWMLG